MPSSVTRKVQDRYGHRTVHRFCPECGLELPRLRDFPQHNVLGLASLLWATRSKSLQWGATLHCPRCGAPLTIAQEIERIRRHRQDPKP